MFCSLTCLRPFTRYVWLKFHCSNSFKKHHQTNSIPQNFPSQVRQPFFRPQTNPFRSPPRLHPLQHHQKKLPKIYYNLQRVCNVRVVDTAKTSTHLQNELQIYTSKKIPNISKIGCCTLILPKTTAQVFNRESSRFFLMYKYNRMLLFYFIYWM